MTESPLDAEQRARADALERARRVLVGSTLGVGKVDPIDLHSLAVFILDGGDLWTDHLPEPASPLWTTGERDAYAQGLMGAALEDVREKLHHTIPAGRSRSTLDPWIDRIVDEVNQIGLD